MNPTMTGPMKDEHRQIGFLYLVKVEGWVQNEEQTNLLHATNV
jgi:hypothetical protein